MPSTKQRMDFHFEDNKVDANLGYAVHQHLKNRKLETPFTIPKDLTGWRAQKEMARKRLHEGIHDLLATLGMDMGNDSLQNTPQRVADMYVDELLNGLDYTQFPKCTAVANDSKYDEMVVVEKIKTISLCEHHLQTIDGFTWIAYLPTKRVLGLSKFARVTEFFARRPQIQERMTLQIQAALSFITKSEDVAVVQRCAHYCMKARGANQQESMTTTSKMGGRFLKNPALRQEFLSFVDRTV